MLGQYYVKILYLWLETWIRNIEKNKYYTLIVWHTCLQHNEDKTSLSFLHCNWWESRQLCYLRQALVLLIGFLEYLPQWAGKTCYLRKHFGVSQHFLKLIDGNILFWGDFNNQKWQTIVFTIKQWLKWYKF